MNKAEFVNFLATSNNCSKVEAEKSLNMIVDGIMDVMSKGMGVNLVGFGSFEVQDRKARDGRNPKTGEKIHIPAYKQPSFKAGKKLKDSCN
jgi:DNA-binding protein HU-beta